MDASDERPSDGVSTIALRRCRPSTARPRRSAQDDTVMRLCPKDSGADERSLGEPAGWFDLEVDVDLLDFGICVVAVGAELAAETGLFVAAPRRLVVGRMIGVDPRNSG